MATNTYLNNDVILKEGMRILENELALVQLVNRDFEPNFGQAVKNGDTIRIARPIKGQVREGATMQVQDTTEGRETLTVATQLGADLEFTSKELTLNIDQLSERYLKPQLSALANNIDLKLMTELVNKTSNWVGTPGQIVNSFADFALAPQRLTEMSVPMTGRIGVMSPGDNWGLLTSLAGGYNNDSAKSALEKARLPRVGNVDLYESQNVITHTNGTWSGGTPIAEINNGTLSATYLASKDTWTMTISIDGLTANTGTCLEGDSFTIENVYAVNPVTGAQLSYLRQFVVRTSVTANGSGQADVVISPPIITSGPYKTCSVAAADGADITLKGSVNTAYTPSMVFHPDAITFAMPKMVIPQGAAWSEERTYKGLRLRLTQGFDMTNDVSGWRFDCLIGYKAHQPWLSTRLSGTA